MTVPRQFIDIDVIISLLTLVVMSKTSKMNVFNYFDAICYSGCKVDVL